MRIAAILALGPLPGCTLVATAMSPVTGPVDAVRLAIVEPIPLAKLWTVPLMILCSPIAGMYAGLLADETIVDEGDLSRIPGVFTPWETALMSP